MSALENGSTLKKRWKLGTFAVLAAVAVIAAAFVASVATAQNAASPGKATLAYFKEKGLKDIPTSGPLSWSVPGCVSGWDELHKKFGFARLVGAKFNAQWKSQILRRLSYVALAPAYS